MPHPMCPTQMSFQCFFPLLGCLSQLPDRKFWTVTPRLLCVFTTLESAAFTSLPPTLLQRSSHLPSPTQRHNQPPDLQSTNRTEPPSPPWHLSSESLDPSTRTWSQSHPDSQTQARQSPPHPTSPARAARAQTKPWHAGACPEPNQQAPQTPQVTSMSR